MGMRAGGGVTLFRKGMVLDGGRVFSFFFS